jgi:hypothetical protein
MTDEIHNYDPSQFPTASGDPNSTAPHVDTIREILRAKVKDPSADMADRQAARQVLRLTYNERVELPLGSLGPIALQNANANVVSNYAEPPPEDVASANTSKERDPLI